ncbi:MAG: penicillin-binding protein 2 [Candidatus Paceibacterota bacterium]|jgi:cell division protein FtsI (penicillin-binding protein 3)/stage V sporulation protein D (sporulation-specific penicillin-binding protein)
MRAQFRTRIRFILAFIVLVAVLIVVRLYLVQIVDGQEYSQKADRQFASGGSGLFDRGSIYFARKDGTLISAATLQTGFLVAINPQTLLDPEAAYRAITAVASSSLSHDAFLIAAAKKSQVYIEVAHHLSDSAGQELSNLHIPGVQVLRERWRQYPGATLASQSIGIVSYGSGDVLAGRTGLEAKYESSLSRSGDSLYKNFFAELFSNVGNLLVSPQDAHEGDIVTTIEPDVQTRLESDLSKLNQKYSSKESGGIIMDPATGAILAIANYPSYDGNELQNVDPTLLGNPLVEHVHEFGSIMKPITMTSGLDAGVITPETTYNDTGCITVNKATICNWDLKPRGVVPMKQVIVQSLNVGAAWIATQLGQDAFRAYFTTLFGEKTGIDIQSESSALLSNLSKPQQIGYDTAAFGQGIAVTPIQMVRALGEMANGGVMVQPHLVSAVRLNSGLVRELDWGEKTPVFSATATRETTEMMTALVDEKLEGGKAIIPTMSVAAKTGTAQLTDGRGGYYKDRFFHSFVGFFPSYNPKFIILLYTNDPQGVQYASETLDTTFLDLVHFLINYYAVPPDRGVSISTSPG